MVEEAEKKITKSALKFQNPPTEPGSFTTIRRGEILITPRFDICDAAGLKIASARLIKSRVLDFFRLTKKDIEREHDLQCRTWAGLGAAMRRYYPGFNGTDRMTVIDFEVMPSARHCKKCDRSEAACRCAVPELVENQREAKP